jgi:hypothetical protein
MKSQINARGLEVNEQVTYALPSPHIYLATQIDAKDFHSLSEISFKSQLTYKFETWFR